MNSAEISDDELIYMYRQKNETAFYDLIRKYSKSIEIFVNTFLKSNIIIGFDKYDLVQELSIIFFDCLDSYREDMGVLYQLVKVCCLNRLTSLGRSSSTNRTKALNTSFSIDDTIYETEDLSFVENFASNYILSDPKEVYFVKETVDIIYKNSQQIFENLDLKIFFLKNDGMSYIEIAKELNVTSKFVDNRLRIIKRRLKKFLLE